MSQLTGGAPSNTKAAQPPGTEGTPPTVQTTVIASNAAKSATNTSNGASAIASVSTASLGSASTVGGGEGTGAAAEDPAAPSNLELFDVSLLAPENAMCALCDRHEYLHREDLPNYLTSPCYHCRESFAREAKLSPEDLFDLHLQVSALLPVFGMPTTDSNILSNWVMRSSLTTVI